ncbi:MAG: trypsin-like peptidase domain-containing protein [Anaerolineales bacterium]|nr:trypsin-like peptidase domain-containing protein [Anaerolineales bacterium]
MDIKSSIFAVLNQTGSVKGTGFLVAPNLAITCAHVIFAADAQPGDIIEVRFSGRIEKNKALVMTEYWRDVDQGDIAILQLDFSVLVADPLPLGVASSSSGHDFYSFGFATVTDVNGIGAR